MVLLDAADQPDALAYHDLTPDGLPEAKVFVKTTLADHELVSVSASHELVEMLVDPAINLMTTGPNPKLVYAYESADRVEALSFDVEGIPMSDFIYPAYSRTSTSPGRQSSTIRTRSTSHFKFFPVAIRSSSRTGNGARFSVLKRRRRTLHARTAEVTAASKEPRRSYRAPKFAWPRRLEREIDIRFQWWAPTLAEHRGGRPLLVWSLCCNGRE